jgi:hypothetical protein
MGVTGAQKEQRQRQREATGPGGDWPPAADPSRMSGAVLHAREQRKSSAVRAAAIEGVTMSSSQSPVKPRLAASDRLLNVPPYALAKLFQDRDAKLRQGVDVLDLGVGNPDIRPPQQALDALQAALLDPKVQNHRYPSFNGLAEFRATGGGLVPAAIRRERRWRARSDGADRLQGRASPSSSSLT